MSMAPRTRFRSIVRLLFAKSTKSKYVTSQTLLRRSANLQVRECLSRGVYVDGLTMHSIATAEEAIALLRTGLENRQVAATAMNETSSRSHSLFTLHVESKEHCGGLTRSKHSRFNLIDLAGSEGKSQQKRTALA